MSIYYIYAYIRCKDSDTAKAGTPYYIGKGRNNRAYTKHKGVKIPKDSYIIILENNLTELGALALERRYIKWWGRKDTGTGILFNKTDGGEGVSGYSHTEESKLKMSKSHTGKLFSDETRAKMSKAGKGRQFSDEHKCNLRKPKLDKSNMCKPKSPEHIAAISNSKTGSKNPAAIPVEINGILYSTKKAATLATGLTYPQLQKILDSQA